MLGSEGVQGGGKGLSQSKPATKILNCEPHGLTGSKQVTRAGCRTPPPPCSPPSQEPTRKTPAPRPPPPMSTLAAVGRAQNKSTHTTNTHKKLRRRTPAHLQGRAAGEAVHEIEPKQKQPPLHIKGGWRIQGAPSCTRKRADNLRPCTPPPC